MAQSAILRWSNPKVILVATSLVDGHALILQAIYQARLSKARVLLVHVIPQSGVMSEANFGARALLPGRVVGDSRAKLDEMARLFQLEGVECEPIALRGIPEEEIQQLVRSRSVDRVIVAARNASGVARLVGMSVADELIARLDVPVCVVGRQTRSGAAPETPLGRVLLATSLHMGSFLLAEFAGALAELNHSQLSLLHVLETEGMSKQQRELARVIAQDRMSALIPNQTGRGVQPILMIREGDPAAIILAEAGLMPQDLVILGSPDHSVVSWLLGTSVASRIMIEAQCPVITIRPTMAWTTEYLHESVDAGVGLAQS